jgi:hypothetical protein
MCPRPRAPGKTLWLIFYTVSKLTYRDQISFKGAYCTVWEKEPCTALFGEMDVMADSFPDMARKIVEAK